MIGMGSIIGLGLKIVANREKIAAVWGELVPAIKTVREQFPKVRDLIRRHRAGNGRRDQARR